MERTLRQPPGRIVSFLRQRVEGSELEQPELRRPRHGVRARRRVELPVDRVCLRLHSVGRDVQLLSDLPEREVRGQEAEYAQLGGRQWRRAVGAGIEARGYPLEP